MAFICIEVLPQTAQSIFSCFGLDYLYYCLLLFSFSSSSSFLPPPFFFFGPIHPGGSESPSGPIISLLHLIFPCRLFLLINAAWHAACVIKQREKIIVIVTILVSLPQYMWSTWLGAPTSDLRFPVIFFFHLFPGNVTRRKFAIAFCPSIRSLKQ